MADLIPDKEPGAKRPQEKKAQKEKGKKLTLSEFHATSGGSGAWADEPAETSAPRNDSRDQPRDDYGGRGGYGGGSRDNYESRGNSGGFGGSRGGDREDRYGGGGRGGDRYGDRDRYDNNRGGDRYENRGGDRYGGGSGGFGGGDRSERRRYDNEGGDRPRREDRPPRDPLPVPQNPPYVAFIGNLAFDVKEDEVVVFFEQGECKVKSVRLIVEPETRRSKGFGYVEFSDRESLELSLQANESQFCGRPIRVDVAEQKASRDQGAPSEADTAPSWRRGEKLPPAPERENRDRDRGDRGDRSDRGDRGDRDRDENPFGGRRAPPRDAERREPQASGDRPKLVLAPRSKPREDAPPPADYSTAKRNPFGQARPRDEPPTKKSDSTDAKPAPRSSDKADSKDDVNNRFAALSTDE